MWESHTKGIREIFYNVRERIYKSVWENWIVKGNALEMHWLMFLNRPKCYKNFHWNVTEILTELLKSVYVTEKIFTQISTESLN